MCHEFNLRNSGVFKKCVKKKGSPKNPQEPVKILKNKTGEYNEKKLTEKQQTKTRNGHSAQRFRVRLTISHYKNKFVQN